MLSLWNGFELFRDALLALFLLAALRVAASEGIPGLLRRFVQLLRLVPGVDPLIQAALRREVHSFIEKQRATSAESDPDGPPDGGKKGERGKPSDDASAKRKAIPIPEKGLSEEQLMEELEARKKMEADPHSGRMFAYVYTLEDKRFATVQKVYDMFEGGEEEEEEENASADNEPEKPEDTSSHEEEAGLKTTMTTTTNITAKTRKKKNKLEEKNKKKKMESLVRMFSSAFMHENALNPMVFPGLRRFETEVVSMATWLLHGDRGGEGGEVVGSVTSGGTESILMAMKTYRDRARKLLPHIRHPEVVAPVTIHPAFEKAAAYFNLKIVHVPTEQDCRPNMHCYRESITSNTILLLGSAPQYPHGVLDPIQLLSNLALEKGLPLHVDACFGGFMLPWLEKLGYEIPPFDFRLPGVTSMSADIHKYGLGIKGASVVLYRSSELRRHQIFAYAEWPGGLFGSPSMAGTRPGGNLAASWAIMQVMGQDGYMEVAGRLMEVTKAMVEGVRSLEDLEVPGSPVMTAFSIRSRNPQVDIFAVADVMDSKGWKMERQMDTLHCSVLPSHTLESAKQLVEDLSLSCQAVKSDPSLRKKGSAGMYGMVAKIPDKSIVKDFIVEFFDAVYTL